MLLQRNRCVGSFGICLGLFSIFFGFSWEYIFYKILQKFMIIRPNSLIFDLWQAPPTKIIMDVYMFNWTNPEDFRNPAIKPKFEELGPYRFYESQEKLNILWHENNASVSYDRKSIYHFDPEASNGTLNDPIVTLNSIAVTASTVAKTLSNTKRFLTELAMMVYPRDLTLRKTVDELLFSGFSDTLLSAIKVMPMSGIKIPFDKYGYFYGRNDSSEYFGNYNVYTGRNNISNIGQLHAWNYATNSTTYQADCSKIRGSAGEFQGPNLKVNKSINIFVREFCRDIPFEFDTETNVDGVPGYRYIAGHRIIDNGTLYPENKCYCNGECLPSGVMNVSGCWFNSPIFISYPHFYKADPYYLSQVEGLSPVKEKHETYYVIEPRTSIGMDIVARTQINQFVQPIRNSRIFHDVRRVMFPLVWGEARTRLTPDLLDYFRLIENIISFGQISAGVFCIIGVVLAMSHPALGRFKDNFLQHFCHSDLEDVMIDENHKIHDTGKVNANPLFFKTFQKWREVENYDDSDVGMKPGNQPLLI